MADVNRRLSAPVLATVAAALMVCAYGFGTYSGVKQLWPVSALTRLAHPPVKGVIVTDQLGRLIEAGAFRQVVIIPAAVGPSEIHRWAAGGALHAMPMSVIKQARPVYAVTHVLWHQGESDFLDDTPQDRYAADFRSLADSIRAEGVMAPVYVSVASFMGYVKPRVADNPIMLVQRSLPDGQTIFAGPDTAAIPILDRFDGIHFSARGQEKLATLWLDTLRVSKQPAR